MVALSERERWEPHRDMTAVVGAATNVPRFFTVARNEVEGSS
ncbi:MAG: hypothetical protein ACP5VR_01145 [Acidimicrobiales bacterium]